MSKVIIQNNVICGRGTLYNPPIKIICPLNDTVEFGNFCAIGQNLKIWGINHDYNFASIQNTFYKKYFNKEHPISNISNVHSKGKIKIGHDVWIGEDVTILGGVTIGNGCVIGKGSIVTKNLEPYTICVGIPCKETKKRFNEDIINFLNKIKWYEWTDEKIKKMNIFFY